MAGKKRAAKPVQLDDGDIRALLEREGLRDAAGKVIAGIQDELWITTTRRSTFALGQSRIGGAPDLPAGTAWPRHRWSRAQTNKWPEHDRVELEEAIAAGIVTVEGKRVALALPFVAQLDLAELASLQSVLPRRGHLWLFADQSTTLGDVGGYPCCASACLFDETGKLARVKPPPTSQTLPGLALAFAANRSLPVVDDLEIDDEAAVQRYMKMVGRLGSQPEPRHACLSRPDWGSIALVPPAGYTTLLRVDSDYTLDELLNWGDAAWITFAIPNEALAARRFDEVRAFCWIG